MLLLDARGSITAVDCRSIHADDESNEVKVTVFDVSAGIQSLDARDASWKWTRIQASKPVVRQEGQGELQWVVVAVEGVVVGGDKGRT